MSKYGCSPSFVKAARLDHLYDPSHDVHARMGHYWWLWLPEYRHNGGSMKRGDACCDYSLLWLCFRINVTFWRTA